MVPWIVAGCLLLTYLLLTAKQTTPVWAWCLFGLAYAYMAWLSIDILWRKVVIDADRLEMRSFRKISRLSCPMADVASYKALKTGHWCVLTSSRAVLIPVRDPWELHRAFVEFAPKKLGAHRMRFPGSPPGEDFVGLWTYDIQDDVLKILIVLGVMMTAFFIVRRTPWSFFGQLLPLLIGLFSRCWGRLDVTREGISLRTPLHRKSIPWTDVKAVFCEKGEKRSFVIVGPACAIHIPAHLAIEEELMKKVMYSIPHPVLCVNFDQSTLRGYRKRKTAKSDAKTESLLPALTT